MIDHRNRMRFSQARNRSRELIGFDFGDRRIEAPLQSIQVLSYIGIGQHIYDHVQVLLQPGQNNSSLGNISVARIFNPLFVVRFSGRPRYIEDVPEEEVLVVSGEIERIFGRTALVRKYLEPDESVRESYIKANVAKTDGALEKMLS